ncbi:MAG: hypothetical protein JNM14_07745 [Ferruginibacter sp.]|nr:hypothetical protein [Ferruginibacter sp.]
MKTQFLSCKHLFAFISASLLLANTVSAQQNGVLPLTGMKFFNEGIAASAIDIKIDGAQLLNNRLPLNRDIEIRLQQPSGFAADNAQTMYAGAEVIVLSPRGEVLWNNPNALTGSYSKGFSAKDLNAFSIKFGIAAQVTKGNPGGTLKVRLYDLKGKNQLRLEIPVSFARPGEPLQVSKSAKTIKANTGVNGIINGLQAKNMLVNVDTTIKVAPKMAYTSVDISNIEGSSLNEIFSGKETFWVYDSDLNEVKITDILLKKVKGAMENNTVNCTLKIPYRLKTNNNKMYTVRYRWEGADKNQVIDVVVKN